MGAFIYSKVCVIFTQNFLQCTSIRKEISCEAYVAYSCQPNLNCQYQIFKNSNRFAMGSISKYIHQGQCDQKDKSMFGAPTTFLQ